MTPLAKVIIPVVLAVLIPRLALTQQPLQHMRPDSALWQVASEMPRLNGRVSVYYPAGMEKRAKAAQAKIETAVAYYNRQLGVEFPISMVLFGPTEFGKIQGLTGSSVQYGNSLPYVMPLGFLGPETHYIMAIPAVQGSGLDSVVQRASRASPRVRALRLTPAEASSRFIPLVGYHELGHVYMTAYGLCSTTGWMNEFLANYVANAFLQARDRRDARLWEAVSYALVEEISPEYRALDDIGRGGFENYVWYQGSLQVMGISLYRNRGMRFLEAFRDACAGGTLPKETDALIDTLEPIGPGFKQWAIQYHRPEER